jgi:hypothetical protein
MRHQRAKPLEEKEDNTKSCPSGVNSVKENHAALGSPSPAWGLLPCPQPVHKNVKNVPVIFFSDSRWSDAILSKFKNGTIIQLRQSR